MPAKSAGKPSVKAVTSSIALRCRAIDEVTALTEGLCGGHEVLAAARERLAKAPAQVLAALDEHLDAQMYAGGIAKVGTRMGTGLAMAVAASGCSHNS